MTGRYRDVELACGHSRRLPDIENEASKKRVFCWDCSSLQPRVSSEVVKVARPALDRRLS